MQAHAHPLAAQLPVSLEESPDLVNELLVVGQRLLARPAAIWATSWSSTGLGRGRGGLKVVNGAGTAEMGGVYGCGATRAGWVVAVSTVAGVVAAAADGVSQDWVADRRLAPATKGAVVARATSGGLQDEGQLAMWAIDIRAVASTLLAGHLGGEDVPGESVFFSFAPLMFFAVSPADGCLPNAVGDSSDDNDSESDMHWVVSTDESE